MAARCINKNLPEFKEIAEALGSPIRANSLITAWQDANKTEALPTVAEAMQFEKDQKAYYNLKTKEFTEALYGNLTRLGILTKFKGSYYVVQSRNRVYDPGVRQYNLNRLYNYLRINNIPKESIKKFTRGNGLAIEIQKNVFTPTDIIPASRGFNTPHSREVVRHLMRMFPQVKVKMLSVADAKILHDDLPKLKKGNVPFSEVKSFFVDGQAILIKGRVTDDVAIEEILHPFVDSLYLDNNQLFTNLLNEAKKSFPELSQEINDAYTDKRGFSEKVRNLELVTQALSRHFGKEFAENETKSFKNAVKQFLDWFMNIIKNLSEYLTGKPFTARSISPTATLSSIARLLNTSDIQFKIEQVVDRKVRYNLTGGAKIAYDNAIASGNDVQKQIIEALFHAAVHSPKNIGNLAASILKDGAPILVLDEATHTYRDLNDLTRPWVSATESIKGKMTKEQQEKYQLNIALGNDFDTLLNSLAIGMTKKEAMANMKVLNPEQAGKAYDTIQQNITEVLTADRSVIIPQVVVYDDATGMAGTIDLLLVKPDGTLKIVDLKTSKNGLKEYQSIIGKKLQYDKEWDLKDDSLLRQKGVADRLSTRQQHNLQVNIYRRMLENMGYTMSVEENATSTMHIKIDIKGKGSNQEFLGTFEYDDWETHPPGQNQPYVDALVPSNINEYRKSEIDEAMTQSPESILNLSDLTYEEAQPENIEVDPAYSIITQALKTYQLGLIKKQEALNLINKQMFLGRHKTTGQLQEQVLNSITAINIALGAGPSARSRIFTSLMRDAIRQINEFKDYVEDPQNFSKPEYISYVLNFNRFMSTFQGLYTLRDSAELNSTQKSLVLTLQTKANDIIGVGNFDNYKEGVIDKAIQDFVKTTIKNKSSRDFTEQELDDLIKMGEDIGIVNFGTSDLATQKDTLLAIMDKIHKAKKQELLDRLEIRDRTVKSLALKLQKLSPEKDPQKMYDYFLEFDKDGEFTGEYVKEIGPQYYAIMKELRKKLYDASGNLKQYRDVTDRTSASIEDLKYNIELAQAKREFADFFRAETIGLNDEPISGTYHEYTQEFKTERAKYERFVPAGRNGYWEKKRGVSQRQYERYRAKYYTVGIEQESKAIAVTKNGEFTGEVKYDIPFSYVRPEYKKVKLEPIVGGKKLDMRSEKYKAIMEDDSALGVARREFYNMFRETFENDLLVKLPKSTRDQMLGKVPLIRGRLMQDLKAKPNIVTKLFAKSSRSIKNLFTTTQQQRTIFADEQGDIVDTMPIFYTGSPRTDEQLEAINLEIEALKQDRADGKIKLDPYKEKLAELEGVRTKLENKPTKGELNRDMANALIKFAGMAEHYEVMSSVEDTMQAFLYQIEKRKYKSSDSRLISGVKTKLGFEEKPTVSGVDSNVLRRAKKWMNMVFYDNDQMTKGMWEKVSDKLIQYSSLSYVAFNPFGNFNNYVLGRINNNIEAIGSRFYPLNSYKRASVEFNKIALPSLMHRVGAASKKPFTPKGDYDPEKPNNKYEALVELFRMMDQLSDIREFGSEIERIGKSYFKKFMDFGYVLQDAAEYNVQTKVGMAMIINTYIRNNDTGEVLSLYDAFEFNSETKEVKLKDGFTTIVKVDDKNLDENGNPKLLKEIGEYNNDFRYDLRNRIREVNKQIHGNYAYEDRMVLQSSSIGRLIAQFHKWVAPAIRARYQKEYYDENLGWMEGRYKSFWNFMGHVRRQLAQGNFKFNQYAAGFLEDNGYLKDGDYQDNERALNRLQGFYRTTGEIGIALLTFTILQLMRGMWADDDDDSDLERRFKNIFMYQADRTLQELIVFAPVLGMEQQYQMIKSPIPSTRTMGELSDALMSTIITPYYAITQSNDEFYENSAVVYQRGRRKGQLKLNKEWSDAVPLLYSIKKWNNYLDMKNFFIK